MANKIDPRVDSDLSQSQYGAGTTGTTGYGSSNTTSGPHNSNLMNEADPRVGSNNSHHQYASGGAGPGYTGTSTHGTGYGSGTSGTTGYGNEYGSTNTTSGPHNSNMMNKLDPRVDSDNSRLQHGSTHTGTGHTGHTAPGAGFTGSHRDSTSTKTFEDAHFGTGPHTGGATGSTNAGLHNSNMMNKVDPRVDSDRDNRAKYAPGTTSTGNEYTATTGNAGPHTSNMANKVDPRVDSDRDARAKYAPSTTTTGNEYTATAGNAGPHTSNMANKADPRVDSDRDTRAQYAPSTTTAHGSYNAGPHNSNMMNKADPRVDSDRDGRAEYAPNTTSTSGNHGVTGTTGTTHTGATTGHTGYGQEKVHNSNLLNKLDPRVDSATGTMKSSHDSSTPHAGAGHTSATASNSTDYGHGTHGTHGTTNSTRTGENVGTGVKGAAAEIHGMGEALRGGMGAAVDRAFGHEEGVAKNDVISKKGDHEMRSGNFSH
ncbi:hypothetical protein BDV06DRAFT_199329 [Aspergillus oleicola]